MLLVVDIGNSRIKFGVFDGDTLTSKVSIPTIPDITSDALTRALAGKLPDEITIGIICSVVPQIDEVMGKFVGERIAGEPFFVRNDIDLGLSVQHEPMDDMGADRLVNVFSAVEKYGVPCVVCSFGTATTIDFINDKRELTGGLIAPGMNTLAAALKLTTSRLPEVAIEKPDRVLQNTTVGGVQSGVVNGYFALVDGLLTAVKKEIGDDPKVIATGGFAAMIAENTGQIDVVDNDLTLDGLRLLHERIYGQVNPVSGLA